MPQPCKYVIITCIVAAIIVMMGSLLACDLFTHKETDTTAEIVITTDEITETQTEPVTTEPITTETEVITDDILTEEIDSETITTDELASLDTIEQIAEEYNLDILDIIYLARTIAGEGGTGNMERAAVAWCVLNRVDSSLYAGDIISVIISPNQFHLSYAIYDNDIKLAADVLDRWHREKNGETNVGRVLPSQYCYFRGFKWADRANELEMARPTKSHNWFFTRADYNKGKYERAYWDWSLPNPYA